jgi:hypothetical protein
MNITFVLAHGGFDILKAFKGTAVAAFIIVGFLLLCVIALMLRDSFRFGREGFPWLVAISMSALFGGVGFWLADHLGTLLGALLLVAFGYGRHAAHRRRMQHD